jgi:flagellar export protein FliJ
MRAFEFPLRRALEWRRTQSELEENALRQLAAKLEELALAAVRLDMVKSRAEIAVRQSAAVEASDLWALAAYRQRLIAEMQQLTQQRQEGERQLAAQRQKVMEAQRRFRLLEKLEQRRHAEWRRQADMEMENLAAESFLAGWSRRAD